MYRLSVANADQCPIRKPIAGWALHALEQYRPELRDQARTAFRFRPGYPTLLAIASGSPAYDAGLREDDILLAVNGEPLGQAAETAAGVDVTYARLAAQTLQIDQALRAGPARFVVSRDTDEFIVSVTPTVACGYEAQVMPSPDVNAGADGERISITSGLVAYASSDNDLALLLGHEMAHNALRHAELWRTDQRSRLSPRPPGVIRQVEQEADRTGMIFAARAEFDLSQAAGFRRRFSQDFASAHFGWFGYPSGEARAQAHERDWREIVERRTRGEPLPP